MPRGIPLKPKTVEERLKKFIKKTSTCWIWKGARFDSNYGAFRFEGKQNRAHRIMYKLFVGKIPKRMCVLHSCDNPPCVNPKHLWIGTNQDNRDDMVKKGRQLSGEKNGRAILTKKQVLEIREKYKDLKNRPAKWGEIKKIANKYKIGRAALREITLNQSWNNKEYGSSL